MARTLDKKWVSLRPNGRSTQNMAHPKSVLHVDREDIDKMKQEAVHLPARHFLKLPDREHPSEGGKVELDDRLPHETRQQTPKVERVAACLGDEV